MSSNRSGDVSKQPWTAAFVQKSAEAFGAAFAPDVVLEATALNAPIIGRDLVKATMGSASKMYEYVVFVGEAVNATQRYLEWQAKTFSGIFLAGVTVLTLNGEGEISGIAIHHRPLSGMLRFSSELGDRLEGVVDRDHFHRAAQ
jgi:hypothetical protein